MTADPAHIIVFGNEKGGSGKSTSALHVAIALLRMGYRVATIDLDARQATMTRVMRNRFRFITRTRDALPSPIHMPITRSEAGTIEQRQSEERDFLQLALHELGPEHDFIVIDTPGTDTHLSRLAHSYADTLVTPLNDSFVDLDVLADIEPEGMKVIGPSVYTKMVMEQKQRKGKRSPTGIRWIVMRNRLSHINAKNKEELGQLLDKIATKFDLTIAPGFGERVIFKELFLKGLTVLDLEDDPDNALTMSQIAARQEVRGLVHFIAPQDLKGPPPAE